MNVLSKLATFVGLLILSAQVQAIEFSFLSTPVTPKTFGNAYSSTVDGLTLTATAWSTTGRRGQLQAARLGIYPGFGMGVCNRNEGRNCSSSNGQHTLNNRGADDLILFTFSSAVQLDALTYKQYGGDSDFSMWAGTGDIALNGLKPRQLGASTLFNNRNRANTIRSLDLGDAFDESYDWLIVAARIGQDNDFMKLRGLSVTPAGGLIGPVTPVPEADTWALMLAGLGLVGWAVRRKAA